MFTILSYGAKVEPIAAIQVGCVDAIPLAIAALLEDSETVLYRVVEGSLYDETHSLRVEGQRIVNEFMERYADQAHAPLN